MHRGPNKSGPGKRIHVDHEAAILHAFEINRDPDRPPVCEPYWCRWGDDPRSGPIAVVHWHVGKTPEMAVVRVSQRVIEQ